MVPLIAGLLHPTSISIIILPFISLVHDYERRFNQFKVPYLVFTSQTRAISGRQQFVFVSAETAQTPHFSQCVQEATLHTYIGLIALDEVQTVPTAQHYRESLQNLYRLRSIPFQWILLSGTIPPTSLDIILHNFHLHPKAVVLRSPTNRPELEYVLHPRVETDEVLLDVALCLYNKARKSFKPQDRGLVYVPFLDLGYDVAEKLGCDFYNGHESTTRENRAEMHERWLSGEKTVMVCTHAFGAGNDYGSVAWVAHLGTPYEMINYVQEVGRAGRQGQHAICDLVPRTNRRPTLPFGSIDHGGKRAMYQLIFESNLCLRFLITQFTDGEGVLCSSDPSNYLCSRCKMSMGQTHSFHSPSISQPSSSSTALPDTALPSSSIQATSSQVQPNSHISSFTSSSSQSMAKRANVFELQADSSKRRRTDEAVNDAKYQARIHEALSMIDGQCTTCLVLQQHAVNHMANNCDIIPGGFRLMSRWRKDIRFAKNGKMCYFCWIPLINDDLHPFVENWRSCPYPDRIPPLIWTAFKDDNMRAKMESEFGQQFPTIEVFSRWLTGEPLNGHLNNAMAMLLWFAEKAM